MDRKEKIRLLKDVETGKISPREAFMPTLATWYKNDGLYSGAVKHLTEAEFKNYMQKHPAKHVIDFVQQAGNELL